MLLDLKRVDLILGIAWLAPLGNMLFDWVNQIMKFKWQDQWVRIQGEGWHDEGHMAL